MEWISIFIGICVIALFFIDKYYWSRNRFASMKAQIESLKAENNTLSTHINLLKDQRYNPTEAMAQIKILGERIAQLEKEKNENYEQIKKLTSEKTKLAEDIRMVLEKTAREEQATRAAYEKQISELKLRNGSSLADFLKEQLEDNKKNS